VDALELLDVDAGDGLAGAAGAIKSAYGSLIASAAPRRKSRAARE
jgi:hypothetical protein